jgi:hypothetical protein
MLTYHYMFNSTFFAGGWQPEMSLAGMKQLPLETDVMRADCLIVHLPSILGLNDQSALHQLRKIVPRRQVWVAESVESASHYRAMNDRSFMALFDLEASYRQSADVWVPYLPSDFAHSNWASAPRPRKKLCCAFISSNWDRSDRRSYVRELMQHLQVDSYGRFMRNRKMWFDRGISTKLKRLQRYSYTLAFENSIEPDYVTEKFFQPLQTGTVPIYLGAPNIDEFAPGDDCYIDVTDFSSPAEVAQFVTQTDPARFHAWRSKPLRPSFVAQLEKLKPHWTQKLVEAIESKHAMRC